MAPYLRLESGADIAQLDDMATAAPGGHDACLVLGANVSAHAEVSSARARLLDPHDFALRHEAPCPADMKRLLRHRRDAPEQQDRVVGERRQREVAKRICI